MFTSRTVYPFDTVTAIVRWISFLAVLVIGLYLFRDNSLLRWFRLAMLWFGFIVSVWAILQTFTSDGKVFWTFSTGYGKNIGIMGPIIYRNHWAVFIEVILPIALWEAFRRERDQLLYAGMAAALYASVIASASRSGTAITTGEILVVIVLMWIRRQTSGRMVGLALLKIVGVSVAFTLIVGWQTVWGRFLVPDLYGERREYAISTLHMIRDRPWFGFGIGTWPTAYTRYAIFDDGKIANRAHSDWLEWTADGGLPLGIMMATLFIWCIRPAFRSIWGLGVIAVFVEATVDYPFSRPALGSWPILVIAMLAAGPGDSDSHYLGGARSKSRSYDGEAGVVTR